MRKRWTISDVMAESPCLSRAAVTEHFAGRDTLTIADILALPTLSDEYKVWMMCRPGALPKIVYKQWQIIGLTRAITAYALPHPATHQLAEEWLADKNRTAAQAGKRTTATESAEWAARAMLAARAARAVGVAGAAWEAAWAVEAAAAAGAMGDTWTTRAAWAAQAARGALWGDGLLFTTAAAAEAAEYRQQVDDARILLAGRHRRL